MLAEIRASDASARTVISTNTTSITTSASSSSNAIPNSASASSSSSDSATTAREATRRTEASGSYVAEEAIIKAIIAGDIASLRRWARQGVRLVSAKPFSKATLLGSLDIMRCLVKEFGADVNQTNEEGATAVDTAVLSANFNMVRFLVRYLGADVINLISSIQSFAFCNYEKQC
jgi:hypothetical protein